MTWGMEGNMPFPMNLMTLVMDMEQMIGEQYSEGLNRLKERCEKMASEMIYGGYKIEEVDMPEMTYAIVRKKIPMSMMQSFSAESYGKLSQALEKHSVEAVGAPSGIYLHGHENAGDRHGGGHTSAGKYGNRWRGNG